MVLNSISRPSHPLLATCVWGLADYLQRCIASLDRKLINRLQNIDDENALYLASALEHYVIKAELLAVGIDFDSASATGEVAASSVDVNAPGSYGTPLHDAAMKRHRGVVKLPLHSGADVNSPGHLGTAL